MRISDWSSDVCSSYLATIGALQDRGLRRELRQRLDRTFCPAHGIMLECMAKTEEEEQQRAFRPSTKGRRARRGNEHQRVDLEALELQILDRFAEGEPTAETIRGKIEPETKPFASEVKLLNGETTTKTQPQQKSEKHN